MRSSKGSKSSSGSRSGSRSSTSDSLDLLAEEARILDTLPDLYKEWPVDPTEGDISDISSIQRIHYIRCQLLNTRTHTGRLASKKPNLLAQPSRTTNGRRVRDCYRFPDDHPLALASWDYSQIEARCLAHKSHDPLMCRIFREGRDIHAETAALIFNVPLPQITSEQRYVAKTINFGIFYGLQAPGLYDQLRMKGLRDWTLKRCEKTIETWFNSVYPGVRDYIQATIAKTRRHPLGLVRTHFGMPRYLPGVFSEDPKTAAEAGRMAVSHEIQGLAQDMIQNAMGELESRIVTMQEEGEKVRWALQVHDEVILALDKKLWSQVDEEVKDCMINYSGIKLIVPVEVDGKMASSWGALKG